MPLIRLEGFEDYAAFDFNNQAALSNPGRTGTYCGRLANAAYYFHLIIPTAAESDTVTLGFALRPETNTNLGEFLHLRSDGGSVAHVGLSCSATGVITVWRGTSATVLATSAAGIFQSSNSLWNYYVEVQAKLHDTTGFVTVRVNGSVVASASNVDTKNAGTKTVFDQIRFCGTSGSGVPYIDDLYLMTGAGDAFLGDISVETLLPNGNGTVNQWTGSDGNQTDNYLLIDEIASLNYADYVGSNVSGQQDLYQMTNLATLGGRVVAVAHTATATKSDTETKPIRLLNRGAGTIKSEPLEPTMGNYTNLTWMLMVNPETGLPFTVAEINALQSGVETV